MNKLILASLLFLLAVPISFAHSGRTDKNGGHNCSQSSIDKGLCTGYHYHNGIAKTDTNNQEKHSHDGILHTHKVEEAKTEKVVAIKS
ncbi:YHYH domain-containing protein [Shewanella sp. T24-MNA-CIBAN-0130]|uniref:YHYH domain-containing protein n=1 Tax=Shewanella sp. T24-MNA-CIBAN-0130 TaxID=3140470 RepID=UPI00331D7EE5